MPTTTATYGFEYKIWAWATRFSQQHTGERHKTFCADIDASGNIIGIVFGADDSRALCESSASWIFYDPFDAPEYSWLAWEKVSQKAMPVMYSAVAVSRSWTL